MHKACHYSAFTLPGKESQRALNAKRTAEQPPNEANLIESSIQNEDPFNMRGLLKINNTVAEYLFDTGASHTVISVDAYREICKTQINPPYLKPTGQPLVLANAEIIDYGRVDMTLEVGRAKFEIGVTVADLNKKQTILLGRDAINACPLFKPVMTQLEQIIIESTKQCEGQPPETVQLTKSTVAAETYYDLRPSSVIMHKILLLDPKMTPIRQKIRRVPYSKLDEFKKLLQDQLDSGIIVPSDSAWCSPVNLVMKTDGSIRITIDYKKLNDACVKDAYPIPHMESLYTKLTHSKFYTKIDCFNGYYQILTDPETSHLTSFGCELASSNMLNSLNAHVKKY